MMHETRANWALSVWVGEIEDLKGLTLIGVPHIKDFDCVIMQIKKKKKQVQGHIRSGMRSSDIKRKLEDQS